MSAAPERPDFGAIRRTIAGEDQHCECAEQYMTPLLAYTIALEVQRDAAREWASNWGHLPDCITIKRWDVDAQCDCGRAAALGEAGE